MRANIASEDTTSLVSLFRLLICCSTSLKVIDERCPYHGMRKDTQFDIKGLQDVNKGLQISSYPNPYEVHRTSW